MDTLAIVMERPGRIAMTRVALSPPGPADIVVDVAWSGISTGTERLFYSGRMPPFPGMGYPLVPGYESVGRIEAAGERSGRAVGETVFIPGASCFPDLRGLFGASAARLVVPGARCVSLPPALGEQGVLLALAATARHALAAGLPELIVGHGVLGRLLARLTVLEGGAPVVWETQAARRDGAAGYELRDPAQDPRRDYRRIVDASGDTAILDALIEHLAPGGEIVLAGFYADRLGFAFPPAFMRELRLRVAAQWTPPDLDAVRADVAAGRLDLAGLISHRRVAAEAEAAYRTAFGDPECLKMVLQWDTP